jgi:hypothetical protein
MLKFYILLCALSLYLIFFLLFGRQILIFAKLTKNSVEGVLVQIKIVFGEFRKCLIVDLA